MKPAVLAHPEIFARWNLAPTVRDYRVAVYRDGALVESLAVRAACARTAVARVAESRPGCVAVGEG